MTYVGKPSRVIVTAGETMLTGNAVMGSPDWEGLAAPVVACQVRLRTDLVGEPDRGLVAELFCWSAAEAAGSAVVSDFGRRLTVPRLTLHAYRSWEVVPAREIADVVHVRTDEGIWLHRVGSRLLDLSCYEVVEAQLLSAAERSEHALAERVLLVHRALAAICPATEEADRCAAYGLGRDLYDQALRLTGTVEPARPGVAWDKGARDADVVAFCARVRVASSHLDLVDALERLLVARPDLDRSQFVRLARERGLALADAGALFDEVADALEDG